jgi:protease II
MDDEKTRFLDTLLLRLAEVYEEGKDHVVLLKDETQAEKEVLAQLRAERSITKRRGGGWSFTDVGYEKYTTRIKALRALEKLN